MKRIAALVLSLLLLVALALPSISPTVEAQSTGCTDTALALAEGQITDTLAYTSTTLFPVETSPTNSNKWGLSDATHWTSGFFPGELWTLYEKDLTDSWFARAQQQTSSLQSQDVNPPDHDIGFKILGSYGNAYRITRDPAYMNVIQTAAKAMVTNLWRQFPDGTGVTESWPNYDTHITVIIDNMMNLELLLFAAQNGGSSTWRDMAVSHALKTMQNHVRADGSTYHVVDYNTDGTVFSKFNVQGAPITATNPEATWSRGQAWAIYGFTMVYRYTKDPRFLSTAQSLANYFINNLPADFVPYWDFSQSGTAPRDSSAAAIAAAGLLELSTYVSATDSARYRTAALNIQSSLSSAAYLGNRTATDGILLHGSANVPGGDSDKSLIYGDYYFLQGCYRARSAPPAPSNVTAALNSSGQVLLSWAAESGPIRYSVKRSSTSGGPYTIIAPPPILTASSYTDAAAAAGQNYYVISAINASGESPNSAQVSANVSAAPTTTSLISSLNPSVYGRSISLTATVKSSNSGTPAGSVIFRDGTTALETVALSGNAASFTTAALAAGFHSLTASYTGAANFAASTSPIVPESISKAATSVVLTSSPYSSKYGQPVAFYAAVKPSTSGIPTGTVTFKNGPSIIETIALSGGKTKIATSKLTVGTHSITAVYNGSTNFTGSTSPTLTFAVSKANTATTLVSSLNPSTHGSAVTFTATVKPVTSGIPTGTVTFKNGSTILATITLSSGKAAYTTSTLTVESHSITAIYNGSGSYNLSTSAVLTQTVK
jgi:unsaturated chondroitin disaccharide hydrolase